MKRSVKVPGLQLRASFLPDTYDEDKRTMDLVWSTGAQVRRYSWIDGEFIEELSLKRSDVRLDRLNNGAPLLDSHGMSRNGYPNPTLDDQLGVVERAKLGKDGEQRAGLATVRFSSREEFQGKIRDIRDGIIRNVSVGYRIHKFEEAGKNEEGIPILRATDWEPTEISMVPIGADSVAGTRSEPVGDQPLYDCELIRAEADPDPDPTPLPKTEEPPRVRSTKQGGDMKLSEEEKKQVREEALKAERQRVADIRAVASPHEFDGKDELLRSWEGDSEISPDQVRAVVLEKLAAKDKETTTRATGAVEVGDEERDVVRQGMANALMHRAAPRRNKLTDVGSKYRGFTMVDMARHHLELGGMRTAGMRGDQIVDAAFAQAQQIRSGGSAAHSTSDFPLILEDLMNKTLRDSYNEAPQTFMGFTREVEVSDFKQISRTQLGDAPSLVEVKENGEITEGSMSEAAEKYEVKTYARKVTISRKAIVNDDLNAFSRLPEMFGRRARDLESDLIWAIITGNPTMADGTALFHADHGNLTGTGTALSVTSLGVARALMRNQLSIDGMHLNLAPVGLIVPVALETLADQLTRSVTVPETPGNANPFGPNGTTSLTPVAEPRLDVASATAWFLTASPSQIDLIEMARLIGEAGPVVESMNLFDVEGLKVKARHDVGVKAIDWRGLYKNNGA